METVSSFSFAINIVLWYAFTVLSTIYSKKYLNQAHDAYTLTLVIFLYAAVLKVVRISSLSDLAHLFKNYEYLYLGLFNIGTILLTNIGINETSVSLTYMVKASEPLFVLLLSYNILEESQPLKVRLTLIPICLGVTLIVYGEMSLNFVGFFCAFAANLSSASRSVFLKAKLKEPSNSDQPNSAFMTYLNMGFVSLCLYLPVYIFQLINQYFSSDNQLSLTHKISKSYSTTFDYLIYGSFFNFLYNLFSLSVLSNVAPISHSIINIMKRVFIVFFSMMIFSTRITSLQWSGMICADFGVFLYSMLKISSKAIKVSISNERKAAFKKFIIYLAVFILIGSSFIGSNKTAPPKVSTQSKSELRIKCLEKIRENIKSAATNLITADRNVHLLDVPEHDNYGDTLIWLGEEQLFKEMGVNVTNRILSYDKNIFSRNYLTSKISPNDTILLHGGGNFGDLYRLHVQIRNFIVTLFPRNRIVMLPQTINYANKTLATIDNLVYSNATDLTIMTRSFDSFEFAKSVFPDVRTIFVPDAAFMLGNTPPLKEPTIDILVIRRIDKEKRFDLDVWIGLIRKKVGNKYTFLVRDWFDYKDVKFQTLAQLATRRFILVNKIMSQGRVIISDRLHASIMSVLMGKPHVIINEKYKKIYNTRESAFYGISECSSDNLRGYYANNVEEAIDIAISILNEKTN